MKKELLFLILVFYIEYSLAGTACDYDNGQKCYEIPFQWEPLPDTTTTTVYGTYITYDLFPVTIFGQVRTGTWYLNGYGQFSIYNPYFEVRACVIVRIL